MHFVPSMLAAFIAMLDGKQAIAACALLRQVFCRGEALPTKLCRLCGKAALRCRCINLYGPTESAVDVTRHLLPTAPRWRRWDRYNVPISQPVWNTSLRILDAGLRQVTLGVAGDLYLTGIQLVRGCYLGRAELTASHFVADP